jgi:hypothetical protein
MRHRPVNRWRSLAQGQKTRSRVLPPSHSGAAGEKHCWLCLGGTRPTSTPVFRAPTNLIRGFACRWPEPYLVSTHRHRVLRKHERCGDVRTRTAGGLLI